MLYYLGMKNDIDPIEYASLLYDFYGKLLDEGKREIMRLYHDENLSLAEIASEIDMSRQAIHYNLKKAESELQRYDDALNLVSTYLTDMKHLRTINENIDFILTNEELSDESKDKLDLIHSIINEMVE